MPGESLAETLIIQPTFREVRVQQRQQTIEGGFVAAVRCCGEQEDMPVCILSEAIEQLIPLLAAAFNAHAAMRLIDDDERRAGARKAFATAIGLDVVQRHNGVGVRVEDRFGRGQRALEAGSSRSGHGDSIEVELLPELGRPLLDQVRWTEHAETVDFAAVKQFAEDEPGFDRLADANIVGDQQANDRKPQRHENRHQLVSPGLYSDARGRAEGPCPSAQRQPQCFR